MGGSPLSGAVAPGGGGTPTGAAGGDLGGTYPNPTVRKPPTVIYRRGYAGSAPGIYATWSTAIAAAQAIPGPVDLVISAEDGTPVFSGTHDLQRRIRLCALQTAGKTLPLSLNFASCELQNAVYVEGIVFTGNYSEPLFTTSDGDPLDLTLDRCGHNETANTDDWFDLETGTSRLVLQGGTMLVADSHRLANLSSGRNLTVVIKDGLVNAECFTGAAGTLAVTVHDAGTFENPSGFSGTLTITDTVREKIAATRQPLRWVGVAGTQSTSETTWTTIGTILVDRTALSSLGALRLHAALEVSAAGVTAELQLLDSPIAGGIPNAGLASTSDAETQPDLVMSDALDWDDLDESPRLYAVQLRRQGGTSGDRVFCHLCHLEIRWDS